MPSKIKAIVLTLVIGILFVFALMAYGQAHSRRQAYGAERAGQVEVLLRSLFPGAAVEWDPVLAIRQSSGILAPVDVEDFTTARQSDGTVNGVTALEVGTAKSDYIKKLSKFQSIEPQGFASTFVTFRMDSSGRISDLKKIQLDAGEPLTKIDWFEVRNWPTGSWPVLHVRYSSYYYSALGSLTTMEWDSLFDTATGSFLNKVPAGIFVARKNGEQTGDMFSVHRTSPAEIQIAGAATKKVIEYPCGDPCVVDGPTLLRKWSQ